MDGGERESSTLHRLLVSGASGFVGAALVRHVLGLSNSITVGALVRPTSDLWRLADLLTDPCLDLLHADLLDARQTNTAVRAFAPDAIVHCAMFSGHPADAAGRDLCFRIAVSGTLHLLEAARETGSSFVHLGSSLVYAASLQPLAEVAPIDPVTFRGAAKSAAHVCFRQFCRSHQIRSCELRIFSAYGPRQQPLRLIPTLLRAAISGQEVMLRPGPRRDYVHIEDVARACMTAVSAIDNFDIAEAFNIGSGVEWKNEETVAAVERVSGARIRISTQAYEINHPSDSEHWRADVSKAARVLNWRPRIQFDEGLRTMYQWQIQQSVPA
jgi:nucleoside-diphosphate-sugar epimerase